MPNARFELAYDGNALRDHVMDVQQLAPALMALGNLIRDTNALLNQDQTSVRVLVQSDFEHKCFSVSLDVVQTLFDQARTFLGHKDVVTAREILEYLGLIGVPSVASVFGYLRWRKGQRVVSETAITDTTGTGTIQLKLDNGATANINQTIYHLAERPEIKKSVAGLLAPTLDPGIDTVRITERGRIEPTLTLTRKDADAVRASCEAPATEVVEIEHDPQAVIAHLRVRSPVFESDAKQWRFYYGEENIVADISETNIAANAIARGGVMLDDLYTVKLEITEHETDKGKFRKSYKIKEVLAFKAAPQQRSLPI